MKHFARLVLDGLLDLVYPPKCVVCSAFDASYLCSSCLSSIEQIPKPYCFTCGHTISEGRCQNCQGRSRSFSVARAVGKYDGALKEAIHRFKYDGVRILAEPFAKLMHDYLTNFADFPWRLANIVIPVPIHPIRQRIRGYNQSELLAERLSRTLGLPIVADAVIRHRYTPPQVSLPGDLRRVNVQGAFRVVKPLVVQNKIVLLVDDVATTCSTIHECSTAILSAGALAVFVVCLAFGA